MAKADNEQEPWLSQNLTKVLAVIVGIAVLAATISASIYYYHFGGLPISDAARAGWGQVGDYFGGMLNPVFGFLTILALVITLIQQSRELKLSREELELSRRELRNSAEALRGQNRAIERQSFEQTFFTWLKTYREMLASIESSQQGFPDQLTGPLPGSLVKDKQALKSWWGQHLSKEVLNIDFIQGEIASLDQDGRNQISRNALQGWEELYTTNEYQLDNIFRILYRLILWIHSQDNNRLSPAQKWLYVSIVRAQLSWIELVYLFYNGHTERGNSFKHLAEKYALFDNLTFATDPVIAIVKACPPETVGYQPSAYDSKLARVAMGLPESSEQTLAMASDT